MNKIFATILLFIALTNANEQAPDKVAFNKGYDSIQIRKGDSLMLQLSFQKGITYQILVQQLGIDVILILTDNKGNKILDKDSPNGSHGLEVFEYPATETRTYNLIIKKLEQEGNGVGGGTHKY